MNHSKFGKITEDDLRIFPPHILFFVFSLLLTTLSAAIGMIMAWLMLDVSVYVILASIVIYALVFNAFVMMAARGHKKAVYFLKITVYLFIGLSAVNFILVIPDSSSLFFATLGMLLGIGALKMIDSERYATFIDFVNRRWARYRATGIPILEEYKKQMAKDAAEKNK